MDIVIVVCVCIYNQYRDPMKQCSIFSTDITFYGIGLYQVGVRVHKGVARVTTVSS